VLLLSVLHANVGMADRRRTRLNKQERGLMAKRNVRWSRRVTQTSNALDLDPGVFKRDDPSRIARSLKRSAEESRPRKSEAFSCAMWMLTFYINRAGKSLSKTRRARLEAAKDELRELYHRERRAA